MNACGTCASELDDSSHFDDLCDECAQVEGWDGPWSWDGNAEVGQ